MSLTMHMTRRTTKPDELPGYLLKSVVDRSLDHLSRDLKIECFPTIGTSGSVDLLALRDLTVIVGVGGGIGLLVALSFPKRLVDLLFDRLAGGINMPAHEKELYRRDAAAETANVILGHCTADLETYGQPISISPPVVLGEEKQIQRARNAVLYRTAIVTDFGNLDVSVIGPKELFDTGLNYVKEAC